MSTIILAIRSRFHALAMASAVAAAFFVATAAAQALDEVARVESPGGGAVLLVTRSDDGGRLHVEATLDGKPALERSPLAMIVDDVNLSEGVEVGDSEQYEVDEEYAWYGGYSLAKDKANGVKFSVRHRESGTEYTLEARAYDDGVAFRHVIPGEGERTPVEETRFVLPAGSLVWYHDFRMHYETAHERNEVGQVAEGTWAAPPLTAKLPGGGGYLSITEGALVNYAGMGLQADGQRGFVIRLGHAQPDNVPFNLRYGEEEAERLRKPATVEGEIKTPWRVVMLGKDLHTLVNCGIVNHVSAPPDKEIFPDGIKTDWLKPGRSLWRYLDGGDNSLEGQKEFSDWAQQLGFEHNLLEGYWRRWSADELRDYVDFSRERGVGIWVWLHSRDLRTAEERRRTFARCRDAGVAGVKIDFLDHEAKEIIDLYQTLLREAAEHKLMVNFHGANKPAGEARTWPNEMTREAVLGMESSRFRDRARHDTTLPFTRFLAGHADYTAVHFGERRGNTTWSHQIATAVVFTSPVFIYGAHPQRLLENPAVEMIKSIPSVWDETIVLPPSEIGEVAVFARRQGDTWFLAAANGRDARDVAIPLSFLGDGQYKGLVVRDDGENPAALRIANGQEFSRDDSLTADVQSGGGFIARFTKQ